MPSARLSVWLKSKRTQNRRKKDQLGNSPIIFLNTIWQVDYTEENRQKQENTGRQTMKLCAWADAWIRKNIFECEDGKVHELIDRVKRRIHENLADDLTVASFAEQNYPDSLKGWPVRNFFWWAEKRLYRYRNKSWRFCESSFGETIEKAMFQCYTYGKKWKRRRLTWAK